MLQLRKGGHLAKNCWCKKRNKDSLKEINFEGENFASEDSNHYETMVLMVTVSNEYVDSKIWFLDTS